MSTHYREPVRPFSCKLCSKTFVKRYELSNHQRVHTNERPYRCPEKSCSRSFRWRSSVRYHRENGVCSRPLAHEAPSARGGAGGSKPSSSSRRPSAPSASAKRTPAAPQRKPQNKRQHSQHHHAGSSSVRQGTGTDGVLLFNMDGMPPFSDPLSV